MNLPKSTVHDIVKNKTKLQTFLTEIQEGDCIKKKKVVRRSDFKELDKAVSLVYSTEMQRDTYQRPTVDEQIIAAVSSYLPR